MPPSVPIPQPPNPSQTKAQKLTTHRRNKEQAQEEDRRVEQLQEYIDGKIEALAAEFNRPPQHFKTLLHLNPKKGEKRQINGFNALVHDIAQKENKGA